VKTISISPRAKTLKALLKKARRRSLILESADGERFVLAALQGWQGFDVGNNEDFAEEVKRTAQNKKLMKLLTERKKKNGNKGYSIEAVKQELNIEWRT
jgi:hypothetical protein